LLEGERVVEYGVIEREVMIEASPDVVYRVISTPEHLQQWWPDQAELTAVPGAVGSVSFGDPAAPAKVVPITVVEAEPPRRFSFRWVDEGDEGAALLVTFELTAADGGTLLRFTEAGFREKGWEAAVLEEQYRDHARGWDHFLPRLVGYAAQLAPTS